MWIANLRYKFVNRGYYRSTTWVLWPLTAAVAGLLTTGLRVFTLGVAGLMLAFLLSVYSQRPLLEWIAGAAAAAAGIGLVVVSGWSICGGACGFGIGHALAGVILMGAVTHAMTLGHWYLNQARLPIDPLAEHIWILFGALAVSAVLGFASRAELVAGTVAGGLFAFSSSSYWWTWLLLLAATAGLGAMIKATITEKATQSATGLLYIAIVTALGAQFILNLLVVS
ncbi:MAG: hypothetical protein ACR2M4_12115 [Actinomycetota bacterium]